MTCAECVLSPRDQPTQCLLQLSNHPQGSVSLIPSLNHKSALVSPTSLS